MSSIISNNSGVKLEINIRGKLENSQKCGNSTVLNNLCVKGEIKRKTKNILKNKSTTHKTLQDVAKAVLRGKFMATNAEYPCDKRICA